MSERAFSITGGPHRCEMHGWLSVYSDCPICSDIKAMRARIPQLEIQRDTLQARLSRYETAMNDAYNVLQAPTDYAKDDGQVFANRKVRLEHASAILKDGLAGILRSNRATPAEEPAESKLEAVRKLAEELAKPESLIDLASDYLRVRHEGHYSALRFVGAKLLAILDAQPSTPEEGAKETKR